MTPEHEALIAEVEAYLRKSQMLIWSGAYPDVAPEDVQDRLWRINTVPSTFVRTRADKIACSLLTDAVFEYDAKTDDMKPQGSWTTPRSFFVELLPIVAHLDAYQRFGIPTMYAYRWINYDVPDVGVLIDHQLREDVCEVYLFNRPDLEQINEWVRGPGMKWFVNARIVDNGRGGGSGDPAIRVAYDAIRSRPHWKDVADSLMNGANP